MHAAKSLNLAVLEYVLELNSNSAHFLHLQMLCWRHLQLCNLCLDLVQLSPAFSCDEKPLAYIVPSNACTRRQSSNLLTGLDLQSLTTEHICISHKAYHLVRRLGVAAGETTLPADRASL